MNAWTGPSIQADLLTLLASSSDFSPAVTLLLGALLGTLVTWFGARCVRSSSALFRTFVAWVWSSVSLAVSSLPFLKEALVDSLSWKTYKKVSPWREATARSRSLGTEAYSADPAAKAHPSWYGSEHDVEFFTTRLHEASGSWKRICQNALADYLRYEAYCRILPDGKTEYKSVTLVRDATAEEMTDFYLDDQRRSEWDGLLAHTELLESGSVNERCEVVRWIRSFPFPFLSDREYVIGRRIFRKNGKIYTVSRGIEHRAAPIRSSLVRMDVFYSMWSCQDVPCPWGSSRAACEVVLLHHEQFKIPERLARFAACKGMWGFIKSMGPAVTTYIQTQRTTPSLSHSTSDLSPADAANRSGKPNKLMRTARRAVIATLVTVILIKRQNGTKPKKN